MRGENSGREWRTGAGGVDSLVVYSGAEFFMGSRWGCGLARYGELRINEQDRTAGQGRRVGVTSGWLEVE